MTNPEKPNVVNYSHIDETSYFFSKIEEMLEWLKYYPNATAGLILRLNNTLKNGYQFQQSAPVKPEMQTAQEIVDENFKGLDDLIEDVGLREWYRSLIVTCIEGYAEKQADEIKQLREALTRIVSLSTGRIKNIALEALNQTEE